MSDGLNSRRASTHSQHNHSGPSSNLYMPMISSPLASPFEASLSSPTSCMSTSEMFQLVPSSPTSQSMLPSDEMDESEAEMPSSECDIMKMIDADKANFGTTSPQVSLFDLPGSSSPGEAWRPGLPLNRTESLASNHSIHQRSAAWKQPPSRPSPRSSAFGDTPMSSPTPLSRAYISKANQSNRSPSELRQQAANRLRAIERKNRSNAHRPLLDAFTVGTRRGVDDIPSNREEMMTDAIGKRHIRHMNRHWEELLSSQACPTDELIEEAEEHGISMNEEFMDGTLDIDPSQIYAEYELPDDVNVEQDTSMASTASTIQPDHRQPNALLSALLAPPSICPACSSAALRSTNLVPPGIECLKCQWALNGSTLLSVDTHFHQHGDRAFHQPAVGYHSHIGTNFFCSNSHCDEMVFV